MWSVTTPFKAVTGGQSRVNSDVASKSEVGNIDTINESAMGSVGSFRGKSVVKGPLGISMKHVGIPLSSTAVTPMDSE